MVWNPGQTLFGDRYIIEQNLGEGGVGITYLATNRHGELRVIKTLRDAILNDPDWLPYRRKLRSYFRDEALRLALCRHPHIVQIENVFDEQDLPCMAMEYVEGEDLGQRIARLGRLTATEALEYIHQIADALTIIHEKGLLHRDIKPANIMIRTGKPEAVLIDFGLAREFIPNVIQKHTEYRTDGFAPPEQYAANAPRGEFIDVYALAATLYKCLTGKLPTPAPARLQDTPLEPPQHFNPLISNTINAAILSGMRLNHESRPQSVQQWLTMLTTVEDDSDIADTSPTIYQITALQPTASELPVVTPQTWHCVHTLAGHTKSVKTIALSADGRLLASGSRDRTIKLWQLSSGEEVYTLAGLPSYIYALALSPNGKLLASGIYNNIKLWHVNTGQEIGILTGHYSYIDAIAISPDSQILASGSFDTTIRLWKLSNQTKITKLIGHQKSISSITFSPNGLLIASASRDKTIKLWNVRTGRVICTLVGHNSYVYSVTFSPDGKLLASASRDRTIKLWNVKTGREICTCVGHQQSVKCVAFSPNGQEIVSGSTDNSMKIWEVSTGREISTLHGADYNFVNAIAFSADGKTLVSGDLDTTIKIWQRGVVKHA